MFKELSSVLCTKGISKKFDDDKIFKLMSIFRKMRMIFPKEDMFSIKTAPIDPKPVVEIWFKVENNEGMLLLPEEY